MEIKVQNNYMEDLVLHCLAHITVNNESNLYDETYIEKINNEKIKILYPVQLENQMKELQKFYNENFQRLLIINFLPLITNSINELSDILLNEPYFTKEDIKYFIKPFISILKQENIFYLQFWNNKILNTQKNIEEFKIEIIEILKKVTSINKEITLPICISLQVAMTRAGRATNISKKILVAVKNYENKEEKGNSLIQVLHELTHMITDKLLNCSLSMDDGTHMKSEYLVIVADYLIIKEYIPELIVMYLKYINVEHDDLKEVLELYPVEEEYLKKIYKIFLYK